MKQRNYLNQSHQSKEKKQNQERIATAKKESYLQKTVDN